MNIIKLYLEHLTGKLESIFPMDSPAKTNGKPFKMPVNKKKKKVMKKIID